MAFAFVTAPIVLGFTGLEFWYYMVPGLTVLAVVGLHQPEDQAAAAQSASTVSKGRTKEATLWI